MSNTGFTNSKGKEINLVLYKFDRCPYCLRVMHRAARLGIELEMRDTLKDSAAREELFRIGGMTQVPCLMINGEPLYESDDIIEFLETQVRIAS